MSRCVCRSKNTVERIYVNNCNVLVIASPSMPLSDWTFSKLVSDISLVAEMCQSENGSGPSSNMASIGHLYFVYLLDFSFAFK